MSQAEWHSFESGELEEQGANAFFKENYANPDAVAGDKDFEKNFTDGVIQKIKAHNFRKQKKEKMEVLKPTKAALFALSVRFQHKNPGNYIIGKVARERNQALKRNEDSIYAINSQLRMSLPEEQRPYIRALKQPLQRTEYQKKNYSNRHSVPLSIEKLLKQQKRYKFE